MVKIKQSIVLLLLSSAYAGLASAIMQASVQRIWKERAMMCSPCQRSAPHSV